MAGWSEIIGPALAPFTAPRRLVSGTLTLACAGPLAIELQHLAVEVVGRINTHLGGAAVQRIRFVQDIAPAPAPAAPVHVPPEAAKEAEHAVAGLPEGELRDALAALGRVVIASGTRPL